MFSGDLADVVRPLERIAYLRQFALAVIANGESAAYLNERETLMLSAQVGVDTCRVAGLEIVEAERSTPGRKGSKQPRRWRWTGILHRGCEHRMLEGSLPFAVIVEAEFIYRCIAKRPSMANVPLLKTFVDDGSEPRNIGPGRFEHREWGDHM